MPKKSFTLPRGMRDIDHIETIQRKEKKSRFRAVIKGERFDPKRHPQKVGVKAVTYHRMEISRKPSEVTVKFILDTWPINIATNRIKLSSRDSDSFYLHSKQEGSDNY